ncbi:MAG TPA: hypothetical protein VHM70_08445 [Polyangiaceae bacterium]|nr:hypothetical protein [Polyangiaceae bacterium]
MRISTITRGALGLGFALGIVSCGAATTDPPTAQEQAQAYADSNLSSSDAAMVACITNDCIPRRQDEFDDVRALFGACQQECKQQQAEAQSPCCEQRCEQMKDHPNHWQRCINYCEASGCSTDAPSSSTADGTAPEGTTTDGTTDGIADDGTTPDGNTDGTSDDGTTDDGTTDGTTDGIADDGTTDEANDGTTDGTTDGIADDGTTDEANDGTTDEASDGTADGTPDETAAAEPAAPSEEELQQCVDACNTNCGNLITSDGQDHGYQGCVDQCPADCQRKLAPPPPPEPPPPAPEPPSHEEQVAQCVQTCTQGCGNLITSAGEDFGYQGCADQCPADCERDLTPPPPPEPPPPPPTHEEQVAQCVQTCTSNCGNLITSAGEDFGYQSCADECPADCERDLNPPPPPEPPPPPPEPTPEELEAQRQQCMQTCNSNCGNLITSDGQDHGYQGCVDGCPANCGGN